MPPALARLACSSADLSGEPLPLRKVCAILNPESRNGGGRRVRETVAERLGDLLTRVDQAGYRGHAVELARRAAAEGADAVVAIGGDGTINEVINGLAGSGAALGILPRGAANDLARLHGIPEDLAAACDVIREGTLRRADLVRVNHRLFATAGGIGLPCEIASIADRIKRDGRAGKLLVNLLGSNIYVLAVLVALRNNPGRAVVTLHRDGEVHRVDALSLMINNQPFLGRRFRMAPGAVPDDGRFDVCLINGHESRWSVLPLLLRVLVGRHTTSPEVESWRGEKLRLTADTPISFFGDGEIFPAAAELRIELLPQALAVIVPRASSHPG
ncbi:MAG TPA: diacylglycerol kinase family protein [Thermoanaerobaculia bacterium]|nr:diacylglycerol kinase family protein [Thermoanaerobaculia bacterium]